MGMSTYVYGIVPADEHFKKMKAIYDQCAAMGVSCPPEVLEFFGDDEPPDDSGILVWMEEKQDSALTEYYNDGQSGFEIDIAKLDPKIKKLRFVNSW